MDSETVKEVTINEWKRFKNLVSAIFINKIEKKILEKKI